MKSIRSLDFGTGIFLILGLLALGFLATQTTDLREYRDRPSYSVTARFSNIGDLPERAPVKLAGVVVGEVKSVRLDQQTFEAVVSMSIDRRYDEIPDDSAAVISTAGLLGQKFISLNAGGSPDSLTEGSEIFITQSAMMIEELVGKYLVSSEDEE